MTADLEALVVAAYVFADEYPVPARPGRPAQVSDAELVALAVCQAAMGIPSDRQFLGLVGYRLPGWFAHLPSQSQYNPPPARPRRADRGRAAAARPLARRGRDPALRRDADRLRQLPGLRLSQRLRRFRTLRLPEVAASFPVGRQARPPQRPARPAARLHARARGREGVRAARRPAHRHPPARS
jgi:hypothetical protein